MAGIPQNVAQLLTKTLIKTREYYFAANLYVRTVMHREAGGLGNPELHNATLLVRALMKTNRSAFVTPAMHANKVTISYIRPAYADFSWLGDNMFLDGVVFPHNISYNSDGAEVYSTDVTVADNGFEQRNSNWSEPLMTYNVAYGVRTMEQLHDLKKLFRIVQGQRYGFRYRDPLDFTSSFAVGEEARAPDTVTPYDQVVGYGTGSLTEYQLIKKYELSGASIVRVIRKPEVGSVMVAANGMAYPDGSFTVDHETGMVTLLSRASIPLNGTTRMAYSSVLNEYSIFWDDTPAFDKLIIGDYVEVMGFSKAENRIDGANPWILKRVDLALGCFVFTRAPGSDPSLGVAETYSAGTVTIATVPAPPPGFTVTMGYRFHIPVRFAVDAIPMSLDNYGIGTATDIKLLELREDV